MAQSGEILEILMLSGLMGLVGQGARAAVGFKKMTNDDADRALDWSDLFVASRFVISLIIGFIAGIAAAFALGLLSSPPIFTPQVLLGLAAAGYAGTDIIEAFVAKLPRSASDKPQPAAKPVDVGAAKIDQSLATLDAKIATLNTVLVRNSDLAAASANFSPAIIPASFTRAQDVPNFGPALHKVAPGINLSEWEAPLREAFERFGLTTTDRVSAAIGQFIEEAGEHFEEVIENMNYTTPAALMDVWPSKFPDAESTRPYLHNPEKLGNYAYAHKLGNGDVASGDGYRFRGRGLIQLTGRDEYGQFGRAIGKTAEEVSNYLETPEGAALSGCWYLSTRGCLAFADAWNIREITRRVNGARMVHLEKRVRFSNDMRSRLSEDSALIA